MVTVCHIHQGAKCSSDPVDKQTESNKIEYMPYSHAHY